MSTRKAGVLAGLALLASCAPQAKTPVELVVLVYDSKGSCVRGCTADGQCLNGQRCQSGSCISPSPSVCTEDSQCSAGETCRGGRYLPKTVELTTPTDLVALQGPVARIVGGASIDLSDKTLATLPVDASLQQILEVVTKDKGSGVSVSYLDRDGVLVPADFHSLNLATTYYNFERTFQFFQSAGGLTVEDFGTPTVYYFPTFIEKADPEKDNAAFSSLLGGFLILPFDELQKVPLAINAGVIGHEYSHAVFNHRLFSKQALPFPYLEWRSETYSSPGLNLLQSLNEGAADVFGTGVTCSKDLASCDATFFGQSLPLVTSQERRLDGLHCMSSSLKSSLSQADSSTFEGDGSQYQVGSVFAGALWRAANDKQVTDKLTAGGARLAMFKTLYKALAGGADGKSGLRELVLRARSDQSLFRLESSEGVQGALDAVVASSTHPALKSALCAAFIDRFRLATSALAACAGETSSSDECAGFQ